MRKQQVGYTLFELIICILLFSCLAALALQIIAQSFNQTLTNNTQLEVTYQGDTALERIAMDLRSIVGTNDLTHATNQELSGQNAQGEDFNYRIVSPHQLMRNDALLANNVTQLRFNYFDKNHQLLNFTGTENDYSAVCYVQTTITLTVKQQDYSFTQLTYLWNRL